MHVHGAFKCNFGLCGIQGKQAIESEKKLNVVHMLTLKTPKDI
jgi:hypothetical protein